MGSAASVSLDVDTIVDDFDKRKFDKSDCISLAKKLGSDWSSELEKQFSEQFESSDEEEDRVLRKKRVKQIAQSLIDTERKEEEEDKLNREKGERIFRDTLSDPNIQQLKGLSPEYKSALVPKDSVDGRKVEQRCVVFQGKLQNSFQELKDFEDEDFDEFDDLHDVIKQLFRDRIAMYGQEFKKKEAKRQLNALLDKLALVYLTTYNDTFKTQVLAADRAGFESFCQYSKQLRQAVDDEMKNETCMQSSNKLSAMYLHAFQVQGSYDKVFKTIADETGGHFRSAPIKSLFRTVEKSAMRHEEGRRFATDNVLDLVRGALTYPTFAGMEKGLRAVRKNSNFRILRIKDRFEKPTDAGWRDVVVNGQLMTGKGKRNGHVVEIQIHYREFVMVRENLGGHFIYAKQRAVQEAFEVLFGDVNAAEKRRQEKRQREEDEEARRKEQAEAEAQLARKNQQLERQTHELEQKTKVANQRSFAAKMSVKDHRDHFIKSGLADEEGRTPAYWAAQNGDVAKLKDLIAEGAELEVVSNTAITTDAGPGCPLDRAAYNGHTECVQLLIDAGVDVNRVRDDGTTPTFVAAYNGHTDALRLLIQTKAEIDKAREDGTTPTYVAAQQGHTDALQILIQAKAQIDKANVNGCTPTYIAAEQGQTATLRLVIQGKADVNLSSPQYGSPINRAKQKGHTDIVTMLQRAGARE